jgi:regulation of enolase protein 1 (concanavalin A-like superfamily)
MKNIITIIAVLSFGLSYGQWTKTYGGLDIEYGKSVQQTVDGGFVFTGSTKSYGNGDYDVWLIKTDNNGDSLWTKTFGGINNDQGWDIKQTTDGGFIISGETIKSFYPDIWLIKTDNNGDTLWTNTFGGWDHEKAYCVNQTSDKGFIILIYIL